MSYSIRLTDIAKKQLKKLPREAQERIGAVIDRIKIRPKSHLKKLVGAEYYRGRAGDYRIICDVRHGELLILVIEIKHRKNVYK